MPGGLFFECICLMQSRRTQSAHGARDVGTGAREACFDCRLPHRAPPKGSLCSAALAAPVLRRGSGKTLALPLRGRAMSPFPRGIQVVSRPQGLSCQALHLKATVSRDLIPEAGRRWKLRWQLRQHQSCKTPAPA